MAPLSSSRRLIIGARNQSAALTLVERSSGLQIA